MKNKINQWLANLKEWRRLHLFTTPTETNALVEAGMKAGSEIQDARLDKLRIEAINAERRARDLFVELQQIKVDVHGVRQAIEIKLTLDRRSLACVDVTTAAEVLAIRTRYLYEEALRRRLGYDFVKPPTKGTP